MRVILLQRVKGLGEAGTTVDVAPGHAKNLLIPRGLAQEASADNVHRRDAVAAQAAKQAQRERESAVQAAERLRGQTVVVTAKAGESGRLFGSVTAADVAAALTRTFRVAIDRRRIAMPEPFKSLGQHTVTLRLHPDVAAEVIVRIEPAAGGPS